MNFKSERLPFSPYAPIRYQNESWWKFAIAAAKDGKIISDGRITNTLPNHIMNQLIQPSLIQANQQLTDEIPDPVKRGSVMGQLTAKMFEQRHWVPLVGQYVLCGKQIFDLGDEVVELLAHTDFGDCTLEDWNPLYDAMFIRFGKRDNIRVPWEDDFEYLDGAFVAVTPWNDDGSERRIRFGFTTVKKDGRGVMMPGYFIDLIPEEQCLPVKDAIERALDRRIAAFDDKPGDSDLIKALNAHRRAEVSEGGEILRQALALLINAMFYLESIGEKRTLSPGRDTPPSLLVQWAQASPKQREKLKSKLLSEGYSTVYLLGQELTAEIGEQTSSGAKKAHWRRGHWRRQHHGTGYALVKKIWLKPQMIGADKVHDDLPGHVYVVGKDNDSNTIH